MATDTQIVYAETLDNQGRFCEPCLYGVVSLYEMLQFFADYFVESFAFLNRMESVAIDAEENAVMNSVGIGSIYAKIGVLAGLSERYGLDSVADQCRRITDTLERRNMVVLPAEMARLLGELRQRFQDDLKREYFLHLDPSQSRKFQKPEDGWEEVAVRFRKVIYNVEESSKCFALEVYGAAVFHILQVAEYGVIQVAKLLEVEGDKPGWSSLKRLQELVKDPYPKRSALAQKHSKLLENVIPLAIVVKDSWRHKLDHVDNQIVWVDTDFSPQVAEEIISSTRGFMRKLASELP